MGLQSVLIKDAVIVVAESGVQPSRSPSSWVGGPGWVLPQCKGSGQGLGGSSQPYPLQSSPAWRLAPAMGHHPLPSFLCRLQLPESGEAAQPWCPPLPGCCAPGDCRRLRCGPNPCSFVGWEQTGLAASCSSLCLQQSLEAVWVPVISLYMHAPGHARTPSSPLLPREPPTSSACCPSPAEKSSLDWL